MADDEDDIYGGIDVFNSVGGAGSGYSAGSGRRGGAANSGNRDLYATMDRPAPTGAPPTGAPPTGAHASPTGAALEGTSYQRKQVVPRGLAAPHGSRGAAPAHQAAAHGNRGFQTAPYAFKTSQHSTPVDEIHPGKCFIGAISWESTDEELRAHFEKFGELLEFNIVKDHATGRPRGFGFITYKNPEDLPALLKADHFIRGRHLDVKKAVPRGQEPAANKMQGASKSEVDGESGRKIFVGGIPHTINETQLQAYFANFGAVEESIIMVDRTTGRSRGFGFVTFEEKKKRWIRHSCKGIGFTISPLRSSEQRGVGL